MKFISINNYDGSFAVFNFEKHDADEVIYGDQVWSDGSQIHVYDGADYEALDELISLIDNKIDFIRALRRTGVLK